MYLRLASSYVAKNGLGLLIPKIHLAFLSCPVPPSLPFSSVQLSHKNLQNVFVLLLNVPLLLTF